MHQGTASLWPGFTIDLTRKLRNNESPIGPEGTSLSGHPSPDESLGPCHRQTSNLAFSQQRLTFGKCLRSRSLVDQLNQNWGLGNSLGLLWPSSCHNLCNKEIQTLKLALKISGLLPKVDPSAQEDATGPPLQTIRNRMKTRRTEPLRWIRW